MIVELRNDFHNTYVSVRVPERPCILSVHQQRRVERALCGMDDCSCGTVRGDQHWPDGEPLSVQELLTCKGRVRYHLCPWPD